MQNRRKTKIWKQNRIFFFVVRIMIALDENKALLNWSQCETDVSAPSSPWIVTAAVTKYLNCHCSALWISISHEFSYHFCSFLLFTYGNHRWLSTWALAILPITVIASSFYALLSYCWNFFIRHLRNEACALGCFFCALPHICSNKQSTCSGYEHARKLLTYYESTERSIIM